ncbi:MAG TPA: hypothetical protein VJ000_01290 [Thermodesulfovibrionia bacterium]|nr:hypothetical protein [Thermodesulfovibrionia bacterium]
MKKVGRCADCGGIVIEGRDAIFYTNEDIRYSVCHPCDRERQVFIENKGVSMEGESFTEGKDTRRGLFVPKR